MRRDEPIREEHERLGAAMNPAVEGKAKVLQSPKRFYEGAVLYHAGQFRYLDGNLGNKSWSNLIVVCPECHAHILLSRFSPEEIWSVKASGLSNARIGRLLGLTRERVRQICKKYEEQRAKAEALTKPDVNDLARKARYVEDVLIDFGRLKRGTDRRTKKKRITAELAKLRGKETQDEGKHKTKRQK